MEKLRLNQAVIVEGRYDKIKLDAMLDAIILPTNGFGIFSDRELRELICRLAAQSGIILLTDSDAAGFKIRNYLRGMIPARQITNVYIPDIFGREKRKNTASKEGKLGVEGISLDILREAFCRAGVLPGCQSVPTNPITKLDLYENGLYGGDGSAEKRRQLFRQLGLPARLGVNAVLPILNRMLTREEYLVILKNEIDQQPTQAD